VVRVAFLVEGDVEKIIIDDLRQKSWFDKFNMEAVGETIMFAAVETYAREISLLSLIRQRPLPLISLSF